MFGLGGSGRTKRNPNSTRRNEMEKKISWLEENLGIKPGSVIAGVLVLFAVLMLVFGIRNVDQGETCAITTFGKISGIANTGFNIRLPIVQTYHCFSQRDLVYETGEQPEKSNADFTDVTVDANTSDGQQVQVRFSESFHTERQDVMDVYSNVATDDREVVERVVKFYSRSVVRLTMQEYPSDILYSGNLAKVQDEIFKKLDPLFTAKKIKLTAFVLRKLDFDPDYVAANEKKQIAKEGITTAEYEAKAAVYTAQKTAELARGESQAMIEKAKGEAEAITIKGTALRNFPEMLKLNFIEVLKLSKFMFLPSDGITPFLPLPTE
jgi:regulator of protease activity HflC (stomatin/prohibitin superfamily)